MAVFVLLGDAETFSNPSDTVFPFFDLPDVLIEKVIKEFIPVSEKVCTLSKIPEFQAYLVRKRLWYPLTLTFFRQINSILPGWYMVVGNLTKPHYIDVDYFKLSVTIYYFDITTKNARMPVAKKSYQTKRQNTSLEDFYQCLTKQFLTPVREFLAYENYECSIIFWIFKPQDFVCWPDEVWWTVDVYWPENSKTYPMSNNECRIFDKNVHSHPLSLLLKADKTVLLKCVDIRCQDNFCLQLTPLTFQLCKETGFSEWTPCPNAPNYLHPASKDIKDCTSCPKAPSFVHPTRKETFTDIDEKVSIRETLFLTQHELAQTYTLCSTLCTQSTESLS